MKKLAYLPLLLMNITCSPVYPSVAEIANNPPEIELQFSPYSWGLSREQMGELRAFNSSLEPGMKVSLELCPTTQGHSLYFQRSRAQGIEAFLQQLNPLEVDISFCVIPRSDISDRVYVSAVQN